MRRRALRGEIAQIDLQDREPPSPGGVVPTLREAMDSATGVIFISHGTEQLWPKPCVSHNGHMQGMGLRPIVIMSTTRLRGRFHGAAACLLARTQLLDERRQLVHAHAG